MRDRSSFLIAAVVCTGLGLASGYYAALGRTTASAGPHDDHARRSVTHFSAAALKNLGVVIEPIALSTFIRPQRVVAVIEATALAAVPVHAPIGGRVAAIGPAPGERIAGGGRVVDLVREPIPPPELLLTREALTPDHGELHQALRSLRENRERGRIASDELDRIGGFTDAAAPLVPRERVIELEYTRRLAEVAAEAAHHELERHGLSPDQIELLASDQHTSIFNADVVRRALEHTGLWDERATRLLAALPEAVHDQPIVVAAVAELVARQAPAAELADWLTDHQDAGTRFLPIASRLLGGAGLIDVREQFERGAFEERVTVLAPASADGFEVLDYPVRPGALVTRGTELAHLYDGRAVRLAVTPLGTELAVVLRAIEARTPCRASPLLPGTGPELSELRLTHASAAATSGTTVAYADLANHLLDPADSPAAIGHPTWALRAGTRYELEIPVDTIENAIVLPRGAVIEDLIAQWANCCSC